MGIYDQAVSDARASIEHERSVWAEQLGSIVESVKWAATLVLAEMGGIVAYRDLGAHENLNLGFGFAIVAFGLALGVFVITVIEVRRTRRAMTVQLFATGIEIAKVASSCGADENMPPAKGKELVAACVERAFPILHRRVSRVDYFEFLGLLLFGLGSLLAVLALFSSELLALFNSA